MNQTAKLIKEWADTNSCTEFRLEGDTAYFKYLGHIVSIDTSRFISDEYKQNLFKRIEYRLERFLKTKGESKMMNDLAKKLCSVELGEVPLWEAVMFCNRNTSTSEEFQDLINIIVHRSQRSSMTLKEFEKRYIEHNGPKAQA